MNYRKQAKTFRWRVILIGVIFLLIAAALVWRTVYLTIFDSSFLRKQGNARILRVASIPAYRGMITDRNGEPMAISTPVDTVWVNPKEFKLNKENVTKLSKALQMPANELQRRIKKNSRREFVYIKRQVPPAIVANVKILDLAGVFLKREFRRYYPEGEVSAHVVGFTNIDDRGQEGMELAYDNWLRGVPGKKRVMIDRLGRIVADIKVLREARPGHNLTLSIDRRIQYLAYRELKNAVQKYNAKSGSIVVLDAKTGEVLAMANQPSFNPNKRLRGDYASYRNRAVTDIFEPGSTMKSFSVANALASGKYNPDTLVDTSPGWMMVDGHKVVDSEGNNGLINVTKILERSSNVGVTKLTLSLEPNSLWRTLYKLGFGQRTGSGFPGESAGTLVQQRHWKPFALATLSFGYAVSATALQLAQAYAILAGNGDKKPVTFLRREQVATKHSVLSRHVADELKTMLESVVTDGTAKKAKIVGYRVAGKTGTARLVGPNGYQKNHHIAMFAGFAPVSKPRLVIVVVINDPRGKHFYGGQIAAPVFARVMGGALRLMDIAPDNYKARA